MAELITASGERRQVDAIDWGHLGTPIPLPAGTSYMLHRPSSLGPRNKQASELVRSPVRGDAVLIEHDELMTNMVADGATALSVLRRTKATQASTKDMSQLRNVIVCVDPGLAGALEDLRGQSWRHDVTRLKPTAMYIAIPSFDIDKRLVKGLLVSKTSIWVVERAATDPESAIFATEAWGVSTGWTDNFSVELRWLVLLCFVAAHEMTTKSGMIPAHFAEEKVKHQGNEIELYSVRPETVLTDEQAAMLVKCAKAAQQVGAQDQRSKTIEGYLNTTAQVIEMAQRDAGYRHMSAMLQRARLYEFDAAILRGVLNRTRENMRALAGGPDTDRTVHELVKRRPPVTDKRPHPVMYLGFGTGVDMGMTNGVTGKPVENFIFAYLVTPQVIAMLTTDNKSTKSTTVFEDGKWVLPGTLSAWVVPELIDIINDENARVVQESGLGYKTRFKSKAKKLKMKRALPPPFYTVHFDHRRDRQPKRSGPPNSVQPDWQHKWLVDAHSRTLVQRGTLPLDEKLKARLLKRQYTVYETRAGNDVQETLLKRRHEPQREGEWLAIRQVWVREHVSPNREDLPLIQGVKKVKRAV